MYTQCPECLTIYKIAADSLQASHGRFRCGHCGNVFEALPTLTEHLPEGIVDELPRAEPSAVPAVLSVPAMRPVRQVALFAQEHDDFAKIEIDLDASSQSRKEPTLPADWVVYRPGDAAPTPLAKSVSSSSPSSTSHSNNAVGGRENRYGSAENKGTASGRAQYDLGNTPSKPGAAPAPKLPPKPAAKFTVEPRRYAAPPPDQLARWPWVSASVLLAIALIAQLGLYQKRALLAHDDFRPWLDSACALLHCHLPLREDLSRFKILESSVNPHPRVKGALLISVSLLNEANFAQNFPIVMVKLSDTSAKPVALRRFAPTSYLQDPSVIAQGIAPNASLPIVFEVLDPGSLASGFEFSFLSGPQLRGDPSTDAEAKL